MVYLTIKVTIFIGFCSCITYFTVYFLTFLDLLFFGLHLCFYHYNFFVLLVGKFIYDFHWTKKKPRKSNLVLQYLSPVGTYMYEVSMWCTCVQRLSQWYPKWWVLFYFFFFKEKYIDLPLFMLSQHCCVNFVWTSITHY